MKGGWVRWAGPRACTGIDRSAHGSTYEPSTANCRLSVVSFRLSLSPIPIRPICPYEATQYQVAVTDGLARLHTERTHDPLHRHTVHHMALLQVMLVRAATALRERELIDMTVVTGEKYHMTSKKTGVYLEAFLRISSEYRRYLNLLDVPYTLNPSDKGLCEQDHRTQRDTSLLPEDQIDLDLTDRPAEIRAKNYVQKALDELPRTYPYLDGARQWVQSARTLAPHLVGPILDPKSPTYNPQLAQLARPP